jgi:hypothetical protein
MRQLLLWLRMQLCEMGRGGGEAAGALPLVLLRRQGGEG